MRAPLVFLVVFLFGYGLVLGLIWWSVESSTASARARSAAFAADRDLREVALRAACVESCREHGVLRMAFDPKTRGITACECRP